MEVHIHMTEDVVGVTSLVYVGNRTEDGVISAALQLAPEHMVAVDIFLLRH